MSDTPDHPGDAAEIGEVGLSTSRLYLLERSDAIELIETAVELGCNLIECSDVWGYDPRGEADPSERPGFGSAEERLGEVLAAAPSLRDDLVVATRAGAFPPVPLDSSHDYLVQACDASLYRLGVERIDLFQIHQPDLLTHPEEVAATLDELVERGKVDRIGVAQYNPHQVAALQSFLETPLSSVSMPFSVMSQGPLIDGRLDQAMVHELIPIATQPLSGGRLLGELTGKMAAAVDVCRRIAEEQGVSLAAVLLAFLTHHPAGVVPVVSTISVAHLREAAEAERVGLSRQQWYEIHAASRGEAVLRGLP